MTGKERKAQEKARAEAAERRNAEWLQEHQAWNWQWPGDGEEGFLSRNCWFTANPKPKSMSRAPGTGQWIYGAQTYYGVPDRRKKKRASRRANGRLARIGLKFGRAHVYHQGDSYV